jgi:RsiW-degrading membrane proteinase PrsW (M82 family)
VAVAPAVFLLLYVYLRDKYEREPLGLIAITFVLGALAVIPAAALELATESFFPVPALVEAFVFIALIEEFVKFGAVRVKAYRSWHFNEVMDGIVYGVAASLGFATIENILYVLQSGLAVAVFRGILSVPNHAVWGGIMGFYLGLAKRDRILRGAAENQIIKGLAIVIFLHGLYDSFALLGSLEWAVLISLLGWGVFLVHMKEALAIPSFPTVRLEAQPSASVIKMGFGFCSQCGARLLGEETFCISCGARVER